MAIGAEFYEGSFNSKETDSGVRKQFSFMNKNPLNNTFESTSREVAYLDIQPALENPTLAALLTSKQSMTNIGDEFSSLYRCFPLFLHHPHSSLRCLRCHHLRCAATPTTLPNID